MRLETVHDFLRIIRESIVPQCLQSTEHMITVLRTIDKLCKAVAHKRFLDPIQTDQPLKSYHLMNATVEAWLCCLNLLASAFHHSMNQVRSVAQECLFDALGTAPAWLDAGVNLWYRSEDIDSHVDIQTRSSNVQTKLDTAEHSVWYKLFDTILLPLAAREETRGNQIAKYTTIASTEAQMAAIKAIVRTLLVHVHAMIRVSDFHLLWIKIVGLLAKQLQKIDFVIQERQKSGLPTTIATTFFENVQQAMRNMLMVMETDDIFTIASRLFRIGRSPLLSFLFSFLFKI